MSNIKNLLSQEEYLSSGIHIGAKNKTSFMNNFIQKQREDGLKILDLDKINERIGILINLMSKFNPDKILVASKNEAAKKPSELFKKLTNCNVISKRYLPGKLTNTNLESFKEYEIAIICDPILNKNVLNEAFEKGIFTIVLCDTNNKTIKADLVIPMNNKSKKSLGLFFYLLSKHYLDAKKILPSKDFKYKIEDFIFE